MVDEIKQYKLDEGLEGLVGLASNATQMRNAAQAGANDISTRDAVANFYGQAFRDGLTTVDPQVLLAATEHDFQRLTASGRGQFFRALDRALTTEKYGEAKVAYLAELEEPSKLGYYVGMVRDLGKNILDKNKLPDDADDATKAKYDALKKAVGSVALAERVRSAIRRGDTDTAKQLIGQAKGFDGDDLSILAAYGRMAAPVARNAEKRVCEDAAAQMDVDASNLIKANGLYGMIDKGVDGARYGKAYSLAGLYGAVEGQREAKAEETEAKGKK